MTISITSNAPKPLSPLSTIAPETSTLKEKGVFPATPSTLSSQDAAPIRVDTVTISSQSQQKTADAKKEDANKDTNENNTNDTSAGAVAKVQFVYNPKGELSIRYMDTASRLIYQIPSELMLSLKEALTKAHNSVDTSA